MDDWDSPRMRKPTLYAALNRPGPRPGIEPHWKAIKHNGLRQMFPDAPPPPPDRTFILHGGSEETERPSWTLYVATAVLTFVAGLVMGVGLMRIQP